MKAQLRDLTMLELLRQMRVAREQDDAATADRARREIDRRLDEVRRKRGTTTTPSGEVTG